MSIDRFADRSAAGKALAVLLTAYAGREDVVVLGLARGGLPVAAEIARALRAPLDVFVVRKLGVPGHEEFALGAITSAGIGVLNTPLVRELGITQQEIDVITDRERRELERRERAYRNGRAPIELQGRTLIVVDDGLATGSTMSAAIGALRLKQPKRIVVATPVASREAVAGLRSIADEIVVAATPEPFLAVGAWYDDFAQTTDQEVRDLLAGKTGGSLHSARIPSNGVVLDADLVVPDGARGIVIFAHGSGSGRHSTRNRYVASTLNSAGLATLLLDLLTESEAIQDQHTGHIRFDVELLARRLGDAARWVRAQPMLAHLPVGYFGASTGAAAALIAAAHDPRIRAVVSRGGRPDLAGAALSRVQVPTLLIVGGHDVQVIEYNRRAQAAMRAPVELVVVPRATHLFEEPGALEDVAVIARDWLVRKLPQPVLLSAPAVAGPRAVV
ncbi:MAG: dienelactone hydrolase family protein [Gemmatimonadaceae bacterium]|nr:dienelactone hydrolase family protein [Gemmatimonadaceae bacterium]